LLNVQRRLNYGDYVWSEEGVPSGAIWILVDLTAQTVSVFRGEHEIGTTVLLYGADHTPTPTGRFAVLAMDKDHWSSSYDAPMPYTLRLTQDGVSIHGSLVRPRAGTHGCVGVPIEFAKKLFADAKVGDEVLITRDASSDLRPI
jgi:lipoprotein-anchoring transpeptidase ErfK/SrfK